jgi:ABC-type transport system involved in cytochrome c biogenesis permease subunit
MHWAIRFAATLLPILYGLVSLAYVLTFFRNDAVARRAAPRALLATLGLHVLYLALLGLELRRIPIATSFESLSALALALGIAYLVQERRSGTPYTGLVFIPLVFVCQTLSSAFANPAVEVSPLLKSPLFGLHIATALLGYAAFAVSAIFGLLYVLLYHSLKGDRFGIVYERLPPLAILVGALWSVQVVPRFWTDPKVWLSLMAWAVYAACFVFRWARGWRGMRIAYFTIFGWLLIVFTMLAANRLFRSFHDFRL